MTAAAIAFAQPPRAGVRRTHRIYVRPFATKPGSDPARAERIREDVMAQLRKLPGVLVLPDAPGANQILSGRAEVWIQAYVSLNPRSGRFPRNGRPLYAGFLSGELQDEKGVTLWSYLAEPPSGSEDVEEELAKKMVKQLASELPAIASPAPVTSDASLQLHGAGATFPQPLYARWFDSYKSSAPHVSITYDPIGSEEGVRKLLAGEVDFGASDCPVALRTLAPGREDQFQLYPSVIGAVAPIANLPGFTGDIAFTPEILAGIYLGKIRKWNDPAIREANHGAGLPDLDITVIHRADGSGTSYTFTDYLSRTNAGWKAQVGAALAPKWPAGRPAAGNDGVAKLVKELGGSIGYVEYIYALENHLRAGKVRNRRGEFVSANLESISAAASGLQMSDRDFNISLADSPEKGAYPIASLTWFMIPQHMENAGKRAGLIDFVRWVLGPGQRQAAALGYVALPDRIVQSELQLLQ